MTLEELAAYPKPAVGTKIAAEILGCDRYSLNVAAKHGQLGADYFFSGNRLYISKEWLLNFCGYYRNGAKEGQGKLFVHKRAAS